MQGNGSLCFRESFRDPGSFQLRALKPSGLWSPPLDLLHSAGTLEKRECICSVTWKDLGARPEHTHFTSAHVLLARIHHMVPPSCERGWRCRHTLGKKGIWWIFSITSVTVALKWLKFEKNHSKRWSPNSSLWHIKVFMILDVSVRVQPENHYEHHRKKNYRDKTGHSGGSWWRNLFNDLASASLRSVVKEEPWTWMRARTNWNLGGWPWSHRDNWEDQVAPVSTVPGALGWPSEHKKHGFSFTSIFQNPHKFLLCSMLTQNHTGKVILEKEF